MSTGNPPTPSNRPAHTNSHARALRLPPATVAGGSDDPAGFGDPTSPILSNTPMAAAGGSASSPDSGSSKFQLKELAIASALGRYIESWRDALKESVLTQYLSRITALVSGSSRKSPSLSALGSPSFVICDARGGAQRRHCNGFVDVRARQGRAARARTECQRSILSHVNDQRTCALCLYSLINFLKQMNAPSFESCSFLM